MGIRSRLEAARPPVEDGAASLDDQAVTTLFRVGLNLQHAISTVDEPDGCQHLQAAVDDIDRLVRTIRNAAFTDTGRTRTARNGHRPVTTHPVIPAASPKAPAELRRTLDAAELLTERLHRVILALTLSQDTAAELLDRLADEEPARLCELRAAARDARAVAATCRDFGARLTAIHDWRAEPPTPASAR